MIYRWEARFKKAYKTLPKEIQEKADKAFLLFVQNPRHPSLRVKKMQGYEGIWECRVDRSYRITFEYDKDDESGESICRFRNIGTHDILEKAP